MSLLSLTTPLVTSLNTLGQTQLVTLLSFEPDQDEDDLVPIDDLLAIADDLTDDDVENWAGDQGWDFDPETVEYRDEDVVISLEEIETLTHEKAAAAQSDLASLTQEMLDGDIEPSDWEVQVARIIAPLFMAFYALGRGRDQLEFTDWNYARERIKNQLRFLRGFTILIVNGELSEAQIKARIALYPQDDRLAYSEGRDRAHDPDVWLYYANKLGVPLESEHCQQCPDLTGRGYVERGELTPLGQRTCNVNCYCYFVYSKELPDDDD